MTRRKTPKKRSKPKQFNPKALGLRYNSRTNIYYKDPIIIQNAVRTFSTFSGVPKTRKETENSALGIMGWYNEFIRQKRLEEQNRLERIYFLKLLKNMGPEARMHLATNFFPVRYPDILSSIHHHCSECEEKYNTILENSDLQLHPSIIHKLVHRPAPVLSQCLCSVCIKMRNKKRLSNRKKLSRRKRSKRRV